MNSTPKLLNLSTPVLRDQRTLIWLQNQDNTVNWSKWDAFVSNISAYNYWSQYNTKIVGIIINELFGSIDETIDTLYTISKHVPIILISQKILALKSEQFWAENFDNILNIDNIQDQYPFISTPWNGSDEDAVIIYALLCRYNRIIDCPSIRNDYNINFEYNIIPNQMWVFTQFFQHSNKKRHLEIKQCLIKNCTCPHIDKIILLNEKDFSTEWKNIKGSEKIKQVIINKRLTYANFLEYVHNTVPDNTFVALSNADIYFGDSLLDLWKINLNDKMLALLRWDDDGNGNTNIFGPRSDSQDSWLFLSNSIKSRKWDYSKFNFQLGQAGCDNAFAGHILRNRFVISNPAMTFKTFHIHNTNIRNYDKKDYIRADVYINITPTFMIDTKQEQIPKNKPDNISNELVSFEIKSSSMSNEITYCTMLEKEDRYKWEPSVENYFFQPNIPVYSWNNACVTPNGLVYDLYTIYKGKYEDDDKFNYWKSANVDILTPLQKRNQMFAIPFKTTDVFKHPDSYILNYLSRCVRLLKNYPNTSFWIPVQFREYLEYFYWNTNELNGVIFDENTACWADKVVGFLPGPQMLELGNEDIQALRGLLPNWQSAPSEKVCAIVVSGPITTKFIEEQITPFLLNLSEDWSIRFVNERDYGSYDSLLGASLCIFVGGKKYTNWYKLWALPISCRVIEFQQELLIDGEFQHLAHIAALHSWVLLLSKGTLEDVQEQIMEQLSKWFKKNGDEFI
jgi:hypothetical protein